MKNRIYLAARYSRFPEMQQVAQTLIERGYEITSRWIAGDHDITAHGQSDAPEWMARFALEDLEDLFAADILLAFAEPPDDPLGRQRGGRHVEFGLALATHKRCILVGWRENVFHHLPRVEFCATFNDLIAALPDLSRRVLRPGRPR